MVVTYKNKFNLKFKFPRNASHTLAEISKLTGYSSTGLKTIFDKGRGAYFTNPTSVRPTVRSAEQWGYARVYSAVMGGNAAKIDASHLIRK